MSSNPILLHTSIPNDLEQISYVDEVGTDHPPVGYCTEHEEYLTETLTYAFLNTLCKESKPSSVKCVIVSANVSESSWLPEMNHGFS